MLHDHVVHVQQNGVGGVVPHANMQHITLVRLARQTMLDHGKHDRLWLARATHLMVKGGGWKARRRQNCLTHFRSQVPQPHCFVLQVRNIQPLHHNQQAADNQRTAQRGDSDSLFAEPSSMCQQTHCSVTVPARAAAKLSMLQPTSDAVMNMSLLGDMARLVTLALWPLKYRT